MSVDRYIRQAKESGCPAPLIRFVLQHGIVLTPKQLEAAAAACACDEPDGPVEVLMGGSRGPGKSHWSITQAGYWCERYPGIKVLYLRRVGSAAVESFADLLPKTIGRLGTYVSSDDEFRCYNGSKIILGHFKDERDIDRYLGLEYGKIAVEESTQLSPSKLTALASCNRAPTSAAWRASRIYTTNPGGVSHAHFKRLFVDPWKRGAQVAGRRFIPCTIDDNPWTSKEYRAFLDGLTGWLKRAWRYGDWDIAAGQFFTTWRPEIHVRPRPERIAAGWHVWGAIDYGYAHWTMAYLFAETGDGMVHVLGEHGARRWLPERHAAALEVLADRCGVKPQQIRGWVAGADCFAKRHTGGTVADSYRTEGVHLKPANDDRIAGAQEFLRRLGDPDHDIAPTLAIDPSCHRLIECLPTLQHDPGRPEDVLKVDCDDDGMGGDDPYDGCRYGLMVPASRRVMRFV